MDVPANACWGSKEDGAADLEYQGKKRKTRRELFLERMDSPIPCHSLEERIRPPAFAGAGSSDPGPAGGRHPYRLTAQDDCKVARGTTL